MSTIGLINPGAMGASVGAAALRNNHQVIWAGQGRSTATRTRAETAGLTDCETLQQLVSMSDVILSVCPPHDAQSVATTVAGLGFSGLYLDANAVAPAISRNIATDITSAGATFVDGGIIGGPAWKVESGTRLYLSGDDADVQSITALFNDSPLHTAIVSDKIGAASALKMVFAAYTKGSTALLTAILATAEAEGVRSHLEAQWGAKFTDETHYRVTNNAAKAWRFEGEMHEIAATFSGTGMPGGFHDAAAEVFARLAGFKDQPPPDIDTLLDALRQD